MILGGYYDITSCSYGMDHDVIYGPHVEETDDYTITPKNGKPWTETLDKKVPVDIMLKLRGLGWYVEDNYWRHG